MIYTIGNRENYLAAISDSGKIQKVGRHTQTDGTLYPGGYAFQTIEAAQQRIAEEGQVGKWSVFGLDAEWDSDTEQAVDGWWHNLLVDADIVVLDMT